MIRKSLFKTTVVALTLFASSCVFNTVFAASTPSAMPTIIKPVSTKTSRQVLVWSNEAAVAAYTYNFAGMKKNLRAASKYFTKPAWNNFYKALVKSGNLTAVKNKKLVVSAVAYGSPVVLATGVFKNMPAWKVQVPLLVSYQSANQIHQDKIVTNMTVVECSKKVGMDGLAVAEFVATNPKQSS